MQGEYLEWTPCASSGLNQQVSLGLSYVDANQHYASIKNMWHHYNATTYRIFESGSLKVTYSSQPSGQKMRVSREKVGSNNYIRYYLNGVLKRTVTDPNPADPMYADISIYRNNTGVCDLKIGKIITIETDTVRYYVKDGSTFKMNEHHLYGSSRLGVEEKDEFLAFSGSNISTDSLLTTIYGYADTTITATYLSSSTEVEDTVFTEPDSIWVKRMGEKKYELSNHLGNVMVVISDRKLGVDSTGGDTANYYIADAINATDYYPFGMTMPGRSFNSPDYRFGFNGMEKDGEEWSGSAGNQLDFGARIYDSRLGRWLSLDPLSKEYPSYSDYSGMNNNPILLTDPTGKGAEISNIQLTSQNGQVTGGTAEMTIYMNLYLDPNMHYDGDITQDLTHNFGAQNEDGTWEASYRDGPIRAEIEGIGNVDLQVKPKVVIRVISYDEAQQKIATETNQANNYYKVIDGIVGEGGHNMNGSNQGVIYMETFKDDIGKVVVKHEGWHSVTNGYKDSGYSPSNPNTYGGHNDSGLMDGIPKNGETLELEDFDAIKPNYLYSQQGKAQQAPIGVTQEDFINKKPVQIGGGVDNRTNLSNEELSGGK